MTRHDPPARRRPAADGTVHDPAPTGGVYWMEASKRRQALEWLRAADLAPHERSALREFADRWRTGTGLGAAERRRLLAAFERVERRLQGSAARHRRR